MGFLFWEYLDVTRLNFLKKILDNSRAECYNENVKKTERRNT